MRREIRRGIGRRQEERVVQRRDMGAILKTVQDQAYGSCKLYKGAM